MKENKDTNINFLTSSRYKDYAKILAEDQGSSYGRMFNNWIWGNFRNYIQSQADMMAKIDAALAIGFKGEISKYLKREDIVAAVSAEKLTQYSMVWEERYQFWIDHFRAEHGFTDDEWNRLVPEAGEE